MIDDGNRHNYIGIPIRSLRSSEPELVSDHSSHPMRRLRTCIVHAANNDPERYAP